MRRAAFFDFDVGHCRQKLHIVPFRFASINK